MALEFGQTLGPYEIVEPLGAGGMGEVYKAKDTRLDRAVAIKVLPAHLAADGDLKQRFEREAKTVSGLNHPNICTLHDVGHQDGVDFLVMELIEGETLAARLAKGPLPLAQAMKVAREVADALDKAHRRSVVHRDLKPGNVMLTKTGAKLLDFGLAKQHDLPGLDAGSSSDRPTEAKALTREGSLLGTFEYMAPEQLEGGEASPQTDIYALGLLLYEMVTGAKAFEAKSSASLVAAIMSSEPRAPSGLDPSIPPALDAIILTCLAKDPDDRWQSAGDVARQLKWLLDGGSQPGIVPAPVSKRRAASPIPVALASLVVGAAVASAVWALLSTGAPPAVDVTEFNVTSPDGLPLRGNLAISPDGRTLVYLAFQDGVAHAFRRSMGSVEAMQIANTANSASLSISPDGGWLAFRDASDSTLKKVNLAGGAPVPLTRAGSAGSSWGDLGSIVYTRDGVLWRISSDGGVPEELTARKEGEAAHIEGAWLPEENALLFTIISRDAGAAIALVDVESGERKSLFDGRSPRWSPSGHIVFRRQDALWAAPFDVGRLELTGEPAPVLQDVAYNAAGYTRYAVANDGTLVFVPGTGMVLSELVWVDASGETAPALEDAGVFRFPRLSPDGRHLAMETRDVTGADFWIYDVERGSRIRLTVGATTASAIPAWTPDGTKLAYNDVTTLHTIVPDGTGEPEPLADVGNAIFNGAWSPDGRYLAFERIGDETGHDLLVVSTDDGSLDEVLATSFVETAPAFSPAGGLLAYVSNESGRNEVYVRSYPGPARQWAVSSGGGNEPVWSKDGNKLFYRNGGEMWAVDVEVEPDFRPGRPVLLFDHPYGVRVGTVSTTPNYDVASDGRFLMLRQRRASLLTEIRVVTNWASRLEDH